MPVAYNYVEWRRLLFWSALDSAGQSEGSVCCHCNGSLAILRGCNYCNSGVKLSIGVLSSWLSSSAGQACLCEGVEGFAAALAALLLLKAAWQCHSFHSKTQIMFQISDQCQATILLRFTYFSLTWEMMDLVVLRLCPNISAWVEHLLSRRVVVAF